MADMKGVLTFELNEPFAKRRSEIIEVATQIGMVGVQCYADGANLYLGHIEWPDIDDMTPERFTEYINCAHEYINLKLSTKRWVKKIHCRVE